MLKLVPINLRDAAEFVRQVHRHHAPPQGGLFAVACAKIEVVTFDGGNAGEGWREDSTISGVAIVGRPVARLLDDGFTAEVTRLATDGQRNACSMLYQAAWRACRALGYRRLITYILAEESGAPLRAAGWKCVGECGGGTWNREGRPRVDRHPTQGKLRFERT